MSPAGPMSSVNVAECPIYTANYTDTAVAVNLREAIATYCLGNASGFAVPRWHIQQETIWFLGKLSPLI